PSDETSRECHSHRAGYPIWRREAPPHRRWRSRVGSGGLRPPGRRQPLGRVWWGVCFVSPPLPSSQGTFIISGNCLCGAVRFEVDRLAGPFELCHCSRCRKVSGSAFAAGIYVNREDLRFTKGLESIKTYEAPILRAPPPYRSSFCAECGSSLPDPSAESPLVE